MGERVVDSGELSVAEIAFLFQELTEGSDQIQEPGHLLDIVLKQGMSLLGASGGAGVLVDETWPRCTSDRIRSVQLDPKVEDQLYIAFEAMIPASPQDPRPIVEWIESLISEKRSGLADLPQLGFSSGLVLNLRKRENLMGILIFLYPHSDYVKDLHLNWAAVLAGQAVLAIENARLASVVGRQMLELDGYHESDHDSTERDDLPELREKVLYRVVDLIQCQSGILYLADEERKVLKPSVFQGFQESYQILSKHYGENLAGKVAKTHTPFMDNDLPVEELNGLYPDHETDRVHLLCVPLIWRKRLIGVFELVANPLSRSAFTEDDVSHAVEIATQGANAIGIANLIHAERNQRRVAEALQDTALSVSGEIELDVVLDGILEKVMNAFSCEAADIQVIVGSHSKIVRYRGYEDLGLSTEEIKRLTYDMDDRGVLRRLREGEVVIVPDTKQDPTWNFNPGREWLRSWAGAPVQSGNEFLGFISINSKKPNAFDAGSPQILAAFAAHTAVAIHKADLFSKLADEHHRLASLYEIERRVSSTKLGTEEILSSLLNGVLEAIDGLFSQVYLLTANLGRDLERDAIVGNIEQGQMLREHPCANLLAEQIAKRAVPVMVCVSHASERYTILGFPIATGKIVRGAILLWAKPGQSIDEDWLDVFFTAGQQAGLALANVEQQLEVQRRLAEMMLLQRIVGAIVCRLEVGALLWEVTEQLHISLDFPAVQIYWLVDGEMVLRAASGPQPKIEKLQVEQGIIGRVVRTGHPALVEDVSQDPDYVATLEGTTSVLVVPIYQEDDIVGVIKIETSEPSQVDKSALELLVLLADQVSVALQNALIHEQVQESVVQLEKQIQARTFELEMALKKARAADHAKARFVGDISHELRTPLTNIGLYLDLVEKGGEERREAYMATLRRETDRLMSLIEQLLAISHLDSGQREIKSQQTDINSLIKLLLIDRVRMIGEKGLGLQVNPGKHLPKVNVDPQNIIQALANLLTNAMNYTPEGGKITIETKSRIWEYKTWVTVTVQDTGPGISEIESTRVFDRFYRGLVGRMCGIPGTGLGLAISKEIVERHGGRILTDGKENEGASFTIWLPVP